MPYQRSLEIERRLDHLLRLIRTGRYSTPILAQEVGVSIPTISRCITALRGRGHDIKAENYGTGWRYPSPADFSPQAVEKLAAPDKVPQPVAKSTSDAGSSLLWSIPWGHHATLLEKVKHLDQRLWYMAQTLADGWSRNVLLAMIRSEAHARQG